MADEILGSMKPQDQTNFLLGQLSGQMAALTTTVTSSAQAQAEVNADTRRSIDELRTDVNTLHSEIGIIKATLPVKAPWWHVVAGVAGVVAILVSIGGIFGWFHTA